MSPTTYISKKSFFHILCRTIQIMYRSGYYFFLLFPPLALALLVGLWCRKGRDCCLLAPFAFCLAAMAGPAQKCLGKVSERLGYCVGSECLR